MKIVVDGLTKSFGAKTAVDNVTFQVAPGAITGCVGVNGSGKTTTMRMMLGLLAADSGTTRFGDRQYHELTNPRGTVGAVIDRLGAHPRHSARGHLEMIAIASGIPTSAVTPVLETVGLADVADVSVGRFSLGMTQRCALAVALLGDPSVLVLDEPATGLDPGGIRWIREQMLEWAAEGRTVFVSTHHLAELASVVDHLVVLQDGRLVFSGPESELHRDGSLEDAIFSLLEPSNQTEVLR